MITENSVLADWLTEVAPALPAGELESVKAEGGDHKPGAEANLNRVVPQEDLPLLSVSREAMACEFEVLLNRGQHEKATDVALEALDLVQELEAKLSVYRSQSDLSTVNRFAAQRPIPVSIETYRMLELGNAISVLTSGAFDMSAGRLSDIWGFSKRQGAMPTQTEIDDALTSVGHQHIELLQSAQQVSLRDTNTQLNPGGIGKGFALDRAAQRLREYRVENFLMHGGASSVVAGGSRAHHKTGGGWLVAVKHPFQPQNVLGTVRLRDEALGTSGSGKQFFHFRGKRYSHIIDPRTGRPAEGLCSATVIAPSAAVADALATALFVMGRQSASEFLDRHQDIAAILTHQEKENAPIKIDTFNLAPEVWEPN